MASLLPIPIGTPIGLCCAVPTPRVSVEAGDSPWEALLALCVIAGAIYWRKKV